MKLSSRFCIVSSTVLMSIRERPLKYSCVSVFSRKLFLSTLAILYAVLLVSVLGIRIEAQTAHFLGTQTSVGSQFSQPFGVATDSQGNLYVGDSSTHSISELVAVNGAIPASPTIRTLVSGWSLVTSPWNLTVDHSGNLYIADFSKGTIQELPAVNGSIPSPATLITLATGLGSLGGLAVDETGNLYFSDYYNGAVKQILAVNGSIPPSPTIVTLATGFTNPEGLAMDAGGDIFVADSNAGALKVIVAVNGTIPATPRINTLVTGFGSPHSIALDSTGNLYFSDYNKNAVYEVLAVGGSIPDLPTINKLGNISGPMSVALSPQGGIYVGGGFSSIPEIFPFGSDFGSVSVGVARHAIPFSFQFDSAGTLGSTAVLTQGAMGLDFIDAGTDTCTLNTLYSAGQTCTINVAFTPKLAGLRNGAVELNDTKGNVIATALLRGTGVGPQMAFSPAAQTTLGSNFNFASGVAVDGNGNAYVVDVINNLGNVQQVLAVNGRIPANPTVRTLVGNLDCPSGPALDPAGNVYFVDICYHTVNEIQAVNGSIPASPAVRILTSKFTQPNGIAVDGVGNVYVLDSSNKTVNELIAVNGSVPASPTIVTLASGFKELDGIAVDGNGNVYVSDDSSREVFEIHAVNGSIPASPAITPIGSGFVIPRGISVDTAGNVYVAEYFYNTIFKILAVNGSIPASPTIQSLGTGLTYANGVAVDASRNVFVADYGDARLVRLGYGDPPHLNFAGTAVGSTSYDSPQAITLENVGNADLEFPILASGNNPSITAGFSLDENAPSACPVTGNGFSSPSTLATGTSCVLPISFAPTTAGNISGSLVLTDNNLNASAPGYASQSVLLSGTATQATPAITWSTPLAITYGTPLSAYQLNATANVPGTFSYSPSAGTVLGVGTQQLMVTFTPTDTTTYTTANAGVQLTVNKANPVLSWPTPAPITYGTALSGTQLNATATVLGTFVYSPAAGTVLPVGTNTLRVTFTPTDSADYNGASGAVSIVVSAPDFSITTSPASVSVKQGSKATSTVTIGATGGFRSNVTLSALGLPKGVSASFSINPAKTSSTITFSANNSASPGTTNLTITGKSGSLTHSVTISLTVVHK